MAGAQLPHNSCKHGSIENLSDDLLLRIFHIVLDSDYWEEIEDSEDEGWHEGRDPLTALGILPVVCRRFHRLINEAGCLWERVRICSIQGEKALSLFSRSGSHNNKRTEWMRIVYIDLGVYFPDICEADGGCAWVDDRFVGLLQENCPNLEKLSLVQSLEVYEESMELSQPTFFLPSLRSLTIQGAHKMESIDLACPSLETLSIRNAFNLHTISHVEVQLNSVDLTNTVIKENTLQSFLAMTGETATSFAIGIDDAATNFLKRMMDDGAIKENEPIRIRSGTLSMFATFLPKLEKLSLSGDSIVPLAFKLTNLAPIAKGCPRLESLTLIDVVGSSITSWEGPIHPDNQTEAAFWAGANGSKFSSLKSLRMKGCHPQAYTLRKLPVMCPNLEESEVVFPRDMIYRWQEPQLDSFSIVEGLKLHCPELKRFYVTRYHFKASKETGVKAFDSEEWDKHSWQWVDGPRFGWV